MLNKWYRGILHRQAVPGAAKPRPTGQETAAIEPLEPRLLLSTAPYVDTVKINGESVSVGNHSATVQLENLSDGFTFEVNAGNQGDSSPAWYNGITMSFPEFTSSGDTGRVSCQSRSSDLSYREYLGSVPGGDGYANYVMVESCDTDGWDGDTWYTWDEENYLRVEIQPERYGTFDIYYRVAMSDRQDWDYGWNRAPSSSAYVDCISFPAYRYRINIERPPEPDMDAYGVSVRDSTVDPGQSVTVDWTAINRGSGSAGSTQQGVMWSTNSTISTADQLLEREYLGGMNAGQTDPESHTITIPTSATPGDTYYIGIYADYDNDENESSESNNNSEAVAVTINESRPDMDAYGVSVSDSTVDPGQSVTVDWTAINRGSGSAGSTQQGVMWSTNSTISTADQLLEREYLGGMNAGQTDPESHTITIPTSATPGDTYYIGIYADYDNNENESSESNNNSEAVAVTVHTNVTPNAPSFNMTPPSALYPTNTYSVTVDYTDPDGQDDLQHVYLRLAQDDSEDSQRQTMMYTIADNWLGQWDGEGDHIASLSVSKTTITNGYRVTWTFSLDDTWQPSNNVDYYAYGRDFDGAEASTPYNRNAVYDSALTVYDARIDYINDNDGDEFFSQLEIEWDADTSLSSRQVYAKVYTNDWLHSERDLGTSSTYTIYGNNTDWYEFTIDVGRVIAVERCQ